SVARAASSNRVFEGERVTVTVTVSAAQAVPLLELFEPLPPALRLVTGRNRGFFTLARGQEVHWKYEVECLRRGRVTLGTVHARLWDRSGLRAGETYLRLPRQLRVYPRVPPLPRLPRPRPPQVSVRNSDAPRAGQVVAPGD